MDAAVGFMLVLLFLSLFALVLAILYKRRDYIRRWLNTPYYAEDDRKLRLQRRIEDAKKELEELLKAEETTDLGD